MEDVLITLVSAAIFVIVGVGIGVTLIWAGRNFSE